jgi:predicted DNA-binding transcriptional regulator
MVLRKLQSSPSKSKSKVSNLKPRKAKSSSESLRTPEKIGWTFLTNHAHVLILLSQDASLVLREVALKIGITERAVQRIVADLEQDGFIEREKVGRKNHYRILANLPLRHPIEAHRSIGDLIALIRTRR